jgi:hypothetical protein
MDKQATMKSTQRFSWNPKLAVLGDILRRQDQTHLEMYLEAGDLKAIDPEAVKMEAINLYVVDQEACAIEVETQFIV